MNRSLCLLLTLLLLGCGGETPPAVPAAVDPADGATAVATPPSEQNDAAEPGEDLFVIDVRTQAEWDSGHVEQAVHIPHTEIAAKINEVTEDKDAKIVLYCKSGGRAGMAKTELEELGYTNVENAGGFDDVKERFE